MNLKRLIVMFVIVFLVLNVAYATNTTEQSQHTMQIDIDDTNTQTTIKDTNQKEIKTASQNYDIDSYDSFKKALTNANYDNVTINIKSDINLENNTFLNKRIRQLDINGNNKTINGKNLYRFIRIYEENTVKINNLTIINCIDNAIDNQGTLILNHTEFNNNSVEINGGAIRNYYAKLTVDNSIFDSNNAQNTGGAILNYGGTLDVTNSIFNNNQATMGGAIESTDGEATVHNSTFTNNSVRRTGGSIYSYNGTLEVSDSLFTNNYASFATGGVYNNLGKMTVKNSVFINNSAGNDTGGIENYQATTNVINSTFITNHAGNYGGALYNFDGNLSVNKCIFKNNLADYDSGAVENYQGSLEVKNSDFVQNTAGRYGGAIRNYDGNLTVLTSNFTQNKAITGGAIFNTKGEMTIKHSNFTKNSANDTAGIYSARYAVTIINSTFDSNIANRSGAVRNLEGTLNINSSYFYNNQAKIEAGAIYSHTSPTIINNTVFEQNTADITGAIHNLADKLTVINSTFIKNQGEYSGAIYNNNGKLNVTKSQFKNNQATKTAAIYSIANNTVIEKNTFIGNSSQKEDYIYTPKNSVNNKINNNTFSIQNSIKTTKTVVSTAKGIIGNQLTLKATLTDSDNNKVTNGYVIFKLNGITIKENKKLTGSNNNLKVYVKNGIATTNITADLDMRHAKNLTAVYAGSSSYNASRSNTATAEIALRNASITVTTDVKVTKQGQNITLKATVKDMLRKNTNLEKYDNQYVFFKINGITLKDDNQKTLQAKIVNGTATAVYTVPIALSGVTDCCTMTPVNHTVTAGFVNPNYYPSARANTTFQVERSNITINFEKVTINNKTHKMQIKANIKDYLGNYVKGPNKYIIKVNGATLKKGTQAIYYTANDGIINIKDITVPTQTKYNSVEIVTQDRLGYKNQRNTTTVITVTN